MTSRRAAAASGDAGQAAPRARSSRLLAHVRAHRRCRACADRGLIAEARPVFSGAPGQRILLVGQAPGPVEPMAGRPFAGRAGRELMRWLSRGGFADEEEVRRLVWMTSVTTCFPGRRPGGAGDRRPSQAEVEACRPWLEGVLTLLRPRLVIVVGSLAVSRLLGAGARLDGVVGEVLPLPRAAPPLDALAVPLPHPSGQSRWLNDPARRRRLDAALARLAVLVPAAVGEAPWPPAGAP